MSRVSVFYFTPSSFIYFSCYLFRLVTALFGEKMDRIFFLMGWKGHTVEWCLKIRQVLKPSTSEMQNRLWQFKPQLGFHFEYFPKFSYRIQFCLFLSTTKRINSKWKISDKLFSIFNSIQFQANGSNNSRCKHVQSI